MKHAPRYGIAIVTVLLVLAAGCDRKPKLVPPSAADSTAAGGDSVGVLSTEATRAWEAGNAEEAAAITARAVRSRLEADPHAGWTERARALLDELSVGSEVAGSGNAVVVNLFSRSESDGTSWPYFFWSEGGTVRMQPLEGRGMRLVDMAVREFPGGGAGDSSQVAVLWGRRGPAGQQPLLLTWKHARGGRWDLAQTLGPDSLGGTGTGQFDGHVLLTRTFRATPLFDECATCPHVYRERHFRWSTAGFLREDERMVPSPYATFTAFVTALVDGDRDQAQRFVVDPSLIEFARRYEWHEPALGRWRAAPGTEATAPEMVFFRGRSDAFRVTFQPRGGGWVVLGFEATTRSVE